MTQRNWLFNRRKDEEDLATSFLAVMAGWAMPAARSHNPPPRDPLDSIDLEKEYQLILQKRSSLPANQRTAIVRRVERRRNQETND